MSYASPKQIEDYLHRMIDGEIVQHNMLDGTDYDQGILEDTRREVELVKESYLKLIVLLVQKNEISMEEAVGVLHEHS